jgi:hypothetical protein
MVLMAIVYLVLVQNVVGEMPSRDDAWGSGILREDWSGLENIWATGAQPFPSKAK